MINLAVKQTLKPTIKQPQIIKLKPLSKLKYINISAIPSRIKNSDINAMFNGLIGLVKDKLMQEQTEKYLQLKLQYSRLQSLYNKLKYQLLK